MRPSFVSLVGPCVLGLCLACYPLDALASTAAPAAYPPTSPETTTLTLDQAIQEALKVNPTVQAAQQTTLAAREAVTVAKTGLLPTVSANGNGAYGTTSAVTFTSAGVAVPLETIAGTGFVSLTANIPVYDSGKTQAAVAAATAGLSSSLAALRQSQQDTALSVATAFFNVLAAEQLTTVRQAQLAQAQAQLNLSQAQVRAGVAAQSDVIQAQSTLAQAQVNLLAASSQIATTKGALLAAIGVNPAGSVEVQRPALPPAVTLPADTVMQTAVVNRPEVVVSQATVASDQAALDTARINAGPQLTVGVGATYIPIASTANLNNSTSYGVTGTASLPLYDSGKGKAEIAQAEATLHSGQAQLNATQLSVRQDAYQAYLAAVQAAANLTATEAAQAAAESALHVAEGQYRAGVGTIVNVIVAESNAAQAEVNTVTAQDTYLTALATLQHSQGIPLQARTLGGNQ